MPMACYSLHSWTTSARAEKELVSQSRGAIDLHSHSTKRKRALRSTEKLRVRLEFECISCLGMRRPWLEGKEMLCYPSSLRPRANFAHRSSSSSGGVAFSWNSSVQYYRKIHCMTSEFHGKLHEKTDIGFRVQFNVEFTSHAVNFS